MSSRKPPNPPRADRSSRRQLSLGYKLLIGISSLCVAIIVIGSLCVVILAVNGHVKTSRGATQIIDLVDMSQRAVDSQRALVAPEHADMISLLSRMGMVVTNNETNGYKSLINPWGGPVYEYTEYNSQFRINTLVTPHVCLRLIELLSPNLNSLGVLAIDATVAKSFSRQIYRAESNRDKLGDEAISAGCYSDQSIEVGITFAMK